MKKLFVAAAALAGSLPLLAAGEGDTVASQVISESQTALEAILTSAGASVAALITAGLAIWGAIAIIGVLKRAFSAGKGR